MGESKLTEQELGLELGKQEVDKTEIEIASCRKRLGWWSVYFARRVMGRRKRGRELQYEFIGGLACDFLIASTTMCYC